MKKSFEVEIGKPGDFSATYGASLHDGGVLFSLFSRTATSVTLCIFDKKEDTEPYFTYNFEKKLNKTGDIWHAFLKGPGMGNGTYYLYKVDGPYDPSNGHRFNKNKYLIDPYAKALTKVGDIEKISTCLGYDKKDSIISTQNNIEYIQKCIVVDDHFDWEGDRPLNYDIQDIIIYEAHVKGLTSHKSSSQIGIKNPGTYTGIVELIPYLKELGITTLELLPVQEFFKYEYSNKKNPTTSQDLVNYWGYSTINFYSPTCEYSQYDDGRQVLEFKNMVKQLHKAGIEVILDVVFNHTGEGNELGYTFSFKGIENSVYYMLPNIEKDKYMNYSGCGNTFNCSHPVVREFIINCLRYWVLEMHVDGFRFDLASILGRGEDGSLIQNAPLFHEMAQDPLLRDCKLILEPWDAGGAYQVGAFYGDRWFEWNDRYRDDVRSYIRGDDNFLSKFATRFSGSSDIYAWTNRKPMHSINFITAHDGFTLNDLVSYNQKHNEDNGENNGDGNNHNISYNYGFEGETDKKEINIIREKQIKNFLFSLLLSLGTPMLLYGDELRRSQNGNNNAYCQDNELSYINYDNLKKYKNIFEFVKKLIKLRKEHKSLRRENFYNGKDSSGNSFSDVNWYNEFGGPIDWNKREGLFAIVLDGTELKSGKDDHFLFLFNQTYSNKTFHIPHSPSNKKWVGVINTSLDEFSTSIFAGSSFTQSGNSISLFISSCD